MNWKYCYAYLLLLGLTPAIFGQAKATVPNPDPEIERKSFILGEGLEVSLYAADPLLAKPIQMNFDPQGRLWVASSEVYPQIQPGQKANDKILILEDTNKDGVADKTTVFADGLLIPTGVLPGDGGAYVANSTEIVHFQEGKPGEKATKSRVVLSGFGTEDTHHIIHTFRWGPDGAFYFNQSIYIHSHVETPHGVKRLNGGGIWRFQPKSLNMEVFVRGFVNSWGHHWDPYGQSFITDGAGGEGINYGVPGAAYITAVDAPRILKGLNPGSPKYCGLEMVTGRHFPDDWQGDLITNDFRGHRVCRFKLSDDGSGYASREMTEIIKTNHGAFRPIDVKMGPDGALYIADWYNPIIQHGEVDFRDPRRDHTHGRIWKVTFKNRPLVKPENLQQMPTAELVKRLQAPEMHTREQARRVLQERGKEIVPDLHRWLNTVKPDASGDQARLEAMWVLQSLNVFHTELLKSVLASTDPRIRAAGVRILSHTTIMYQDAFAWLKKAITDPYPRVRMEAVRALARIPQAEALTVALQALDAPMDRFLEMALWLTVRELEPYWLAKFEANELPLAKNARHLVFALQATTSRKTAGSLTQLLTTDRIPADQQLEVWRLVADVGGSKELEMVFDRVNRTTSLEEKEALLAKLADTTEQRKVRWNASEKQLQELCTPTERVGVAVQALRLAGLLNSKFLLPQVEAQVKKETTSDYRKAAFGALLRQNPPVGRKLVETLAENAPTLVRQDAITQLAAVAPQLAAKHASGLLSQITPEQLDADLFRAFVSRRGASNQLAGTVNNISVAPDVARIGLRVARAGGPDAQSLVAALTKAGKLAEPKTTLTADELKSYVEDVLKSGNAQRGEQIYRRAELNCMTCHAIAGAGGAVGPDMSSIGASAQVDYLVESIISPVKAVKEGYHAVRVELLSGKAIVGIKTKEANGKLYLRTEEDKEVVIENDDIAEVKQSRSLMPDGLAEQLTRAEFVDLVKFLSELGKVGGPYAPDKTRYFRTWKVLQATPENLHRTRRTRLTDAGENPDLYVWNSTYSQVRGELPLDALPKLVVWNGNDPMSVISTRVDVTTAGSVGLKFNDPTGLDLLVDGQPVLFTQLKDLNLKQGVHTITVLINRNKRQQPVSLELVDVPGSPAKAAVQLGK
ncbi:MAG: HEAT repeat domain-containing protein [Zavarzinella sp.]